MGDAARVYTDCSQAQPSGPNQLSLTYLVPAPPIGPFEIFSQSEVAGQPKRARLEQASSSLVTESVKQNGVQCFVGKPLSALKQGENTKF